MNHNQEQKTRQIQPVLNSLTIQQPTTDNTKNVELFRQTLATTVIALYIIWVLLGFILLIVTGSIWLLVSSPVLAYPLHKVFNYYFAHSKI